MFACRVRNMIDELSDGVRPLELWPFETTQAGDKRSGKANARQPSGEWTAHSRVQTVARRRRAEIPGQRRLVEAVVADASFVHPAGAGRPNPAASDHLRPGVDLRSPLGLQLRKIFHRPRVIPVKINSAHAVALVEVVIDFRQRVVDSNIVAKSRLGADPLRVVDGEACTLTSDRRAGHAAPRDQLAGRT